MAIICVQNPLFLIAKYKLLVEAQFKAPITVHPYEPERFTKKNQRIRNGPADFTEDF